MNRRVYQSLFLDIAENFFQYIYSFDLDEIQDLESDIKANGWRVETITEIQDANVLLPQQETSFY